MPAFLGVGFAAWCLEPLWAISDAPSALRLLRLGWDHAAHFNMVEMIRRSGSLAGLVEPGEFESMAYRNYPKGFHAGAATVMDVTVGRSVLDPSAELMGYAQATALISLGVVALLLFGIVALPQVRRNLLLATAMSVLVTLAFTVGPAGAGTLIFYGFPNFLVSVGLLGAIPLLAILLERVSGLTALLALSACFIGIAHNWAILLIPAAAGAAALAFPFRRGRLPRSRGGWAALAVSAALAAVGGLLAFQTLRGGPQGGTTVSQLLVNGGFYGGSRTEMLIAPALAVLVCVAVGLRSARLAGHSRRGRAVRVGVLALFPTTGLLLVGAIAVYQLTQIHELAYYFFKTGAAVQLASTVLLAAASATFVRLVSGSTRSRALAAGTAVVLTMVLVVYSGAVNPTSEGIGLRVPPGLEARSTWQAAEYPESDDSVSRIDELAASAVTSDGHRYVVPSELDGSTAPRLANQWLFALTGQWTDAGYKVIDELWGDSVPRSDRPATVAEAVRALYAADPHAVIIVAPEELPALRSDSSLDRATIVSW